MIDRSNSLLLCGLVSAALALLVGCQSVDAPEPVESTTRPLGISMTLPANVALDSIRGTLRKSTVQGIQFERSTTGVGIRIEPAPVVGTDTLHLEAWAFGLQYRRVGIVMHDNKGQKSYDIVDPLIKQLVLCLDTALVAAVGLSPRRGFDSLLGRVIATGDTAYRAWGVRPPTGLTTKRLDSLSLLHLARTGTKLHTALRVWFSTLDSLAAVDQLRAFRVEGVISIEQFDVVVGRPVVVDPGDPDPAPDTLAPKLTRILPGNRKDSVLDTVTSARIRYTITDEHLAWVSLNDRRVVLSNGLLDTILPLTLGATLEVRISASDSAGHSSHDTVWIHRRIAVPPRYERMSPVRGTDSVLDTTSAYVVRWRLIDDDLDSVTIDGSPVLLEGGVATRSVDLNLDRTRAVTLRAIDRLRHEVRDTVSVHRKASVPPRVQRMGSTDRVRVVPDSQAFAEASWSVLDANLDSVTIRGVVASPVASVFGARVALLIGDTTRVALRAIDAYRSETLDTILVFRPDPRSPYQSLIDSLQRGDSLLSMVPLLPSGLRFGRFEVTEGLYAKVMKRTAPQTPGLPVANVTIYDAMLFCNALSKSVGLDTFYTHSGRVAANGYLKDFAVRPDTIDPSAGTKVIRKGFRLPTAVEWDLAANAWSSIHPWGSSEDPQVVAQYAVWNAIDPAMVGSRHPTGPGLFDLAGNAREWVYRNRGMLDDLTSWQVKGGSFLDATTTNLGTAAQWETGTSASRSIGFRIVLTGQN